MVLMRVPYPMGYYAKGLDARIDDPNAGWKGRGLWSANGDRTPWLNEHGKGAVRWPCTSRCGRIRWRIDLSFPLPLAGEGQGTAKSHEFRPAPQAPGDVLVAPRC